MTNAADNFDLFETQRWMQATITHSGGINAKSDALGLVRSTNLPAAERLAIYARSYHARLLECFRAMFPVLLEALGEDLFSRFAFDYLQQHPSHSYTLDRLADAFPRYLADTRPAADPQSGERESWPDFIIELATLELAFVKVYDGAGLEGLKPLTVIQLEPSTLEQLRPMPSPSLRLLAFHYPVHRYWSAVRRGEKLPLPPAAETYVAMIRRNYRVRLHELTAPQFALLQRLDGHSSLAQATADFPFATLQRWMADWITAGFFADLTSHQA